MSLSVHSEINVKIIKMKNQILSIGKALSRAEQKQVFGGDTIGLPGDDGICYTGTCRTDTEKDCCQGSCQTRNGKVVGECFGQ